MVKFLTDFNNLNSEMSSQLNSRVESSINFELQLCLSFQQHVAEWEFMRDKWLIFGIFCSLMTGVLS